MFILQISGKNEEDCQCLVSFMHIQFRHLV